MTRFTNLVKIDPLALEALNKFKLPKDNIGFGRIIAPIMIECDFANGAWGELKLVPYGAISLEPTCKVFHYAQEIFEGLKAYQIDDKGPLLFRPDENAKRFNLSALRMAMPIFPIQQFITAVECITAYMAPFIPGQSGDSLYIRPFMFATEPGLGIKPSENFKFMVVASPSGSYFTEGTLSVLIERDAVRAFPGGTGMAKTGGNYARSLKTAIEAKELGYQQTLWLDAHHRQLVEEMSGMNFFAVINGDLVTPPVSDTILDGITRRSLIELAPKLNFSVHERPLNISELIELIKNGQCSEAFACGTAAIITPIQSLGEKDGTRYLLPPAPGPVAQTLRKNLLDIQEGRKQDTHGWIYKVHSFI